MKKGVKGLIISIIITLSIVLVSIPLWSFSSGNRIGILANSYYDLPITITIGKFSPLIVIPDEYVADNIEPTIIQMRNKNGFEKECELYMLITKDSTLDYNILHLAIDDNYYKLNELEKSEDDVNYYFKIDKYSIESYSNKEILAKIWIDGSVEYLDGNSKLTANFIIR